MSNPRASDEILILSALPIEQDAILRCLGNHSETTVAGFLAKRAVLEDMSVMVACLYGMGNVNAASRTATILAVAPAPTVLLVGIAGGTNKPTSVWFSDKTHLLGDVLVAEQVVDYESGKQKPTGLEGRPRAFPASAILLATAKDTNPSDWVHSVTESRPDGSSGRVMPVVHFGTVGSGEKVIADASFVDPLKRVWTQLLGVEMEALGVAIACHQQERSVRFMMIKAICDWADPEKNDGWQKYAADAAASFAVALLKKLSRGKANSSMTLKTTVQVSAKLHFIQRLHDSWKDLSDSLQIPVHERKQFHQGDEARAIWEWLEARGRLSDLPAALSCIDRGELARGLESNP
jgi:nucleoside phosphorylase